jgi:hypothetical protein
LRTRDGCPDAGSPADNGETGDEDAESCISHEGYLLFLAVSGRHITGREQVYRWRLCAS